MKKILYITWNEAWSPVLRGQAGDVVKLLNSVAPDIQASLASGLSIRGFLKERRAIREFDPRASVLPVYPGNRNWRKNVPWLAWNLNRLKPAALICRGPVGTVLALRARIVAKSSVAICYDGRGARTSEIEEYSPSDPLAAEMEQIEREAIHHADWRIAVSEKLVNHWCERFSYKGTNHTLIPCSLAHQFDGIRQNEAALVRKRFGWPDETRIIVHSGGGADWQHSEVTFRALRHWLTVEPDLRLLILSKPTAEFDQLSSEFSTKICITQVSHQEMPVVLSGCDYGLLIRRDNVTNRVASPVKFAEYLSCGLRILISPSLGDFSQLTEQQNLGEIVYEGNFSVMRFPAVDPGEKRRISATGLAYFSKSNTSIRKLYEEVALALVGKDRC